MKYCRRTYLTVILSSIKNSERSPLYVLTLNLIFYSFHSSNILFILFFLIIPIFFILLLLLMVTLSI